MDYCSWLPLSCSVIKLLVFSFSEVSLIPALPLFVYVYTCFLPFQTQMMKLYRDPKGENIFTTAAITENDGAVATTTVYTAGTVNDERVLKLEKTVRELQTRLSRYEGFEVS